MHKLYKILTITFLTLIINFAHAKTDKLTIGLDWFINPDHAPLIIAQKRGFFKEVGLEVEMIEPADPNVLFAADPLDTAIALVVYILNPNKGLSVIIPFLIAEADPSAITD